MCGTELEVPLVTSQSTPTTTKASLLVTGRKPGIANIDLGSVTPLPGLSLDVDSYVSQIVAGSDSTYYSLVRSCQNRAVGTAVRTTDGSGEEELANDADFYGLLSDGQGGVWGERHLSRPEAAISSTLVRLDRPGKAITLPISLNPIGLYRDQLIATGDPLRATPTQSPLYLFDLTTRKYRLIGNSFSVTVSGHRALWNSTACSDTGPCRLHTFDLARGTTTERNYYLPMESNFNGAVLSPDGVQLAYGLAQETQDRNYRSESSNGTPTNLVVLDLQTGNVDPIPNLELAPGSTPAELSFSPDGRTLLIGLDADGGTMLLSWESGLTKPVLSHAD